MSTNTRAAKTKNVLTCDTRSPASASSIPLLDDIEKKLLAQRAFFADQLKLMEDRIMQRIGVVSAELSNIRSDFKSLVEKHNTLEIKCNSFGNDIDRLHSQVSMLENATVSNDLILLNAPNAINASVIVDNIMKTLCCNSLAINKVFRTSKNINNAKSVPIIVKLKSPDERVKFFRSLAEFRKNNKRQLKLSDVGFDGEGELVMRECLTTYNRLIFRTALEYKKKQILNSVFSLRGSVYVRATAGSDAVKIGDMMSLNLSTFFLIFIFCFFINY